MYLFLMKSLCTTYNIDSRSCRAFTIVFTIMPKSCVAVGCHSHNMDGNDRSFYTFPSRERSPERRAKWVQAVKRINADGTKWSPSKHAVVCSKHFESGTCIKF